METHRTPPTQKTYKAAKLAVLVIALALAGLAISTWRPIWLWITTVRIPYEVTFDKDGTTYSHRGWQTVKRWERGVRHGPWVTFYADTGFMAREANYLNGELVTSTDWNPDGSIRFQTTYLDEDGDRLRHGQDGRWSPPWWFGKVDQTRPSAPAWIMDDKRWEAARSRSRP